MSGSLFLDWATLAVSLFNTILTLWLGLTVLLNAERRTLGIWLAGGGLLLGAAFFFSHSAILGLGQMPYRADLWWRLGWIPVILAPSAWYVVMLWYAGFWEQDQAGLRRRHRVWLWIILLANAAMLVTFLVANPLPSFAQAYEFNFDATPSLLGAPILMIIYPLYILACIGLSLDALLRPGPTMRMMGGEARRRARPWLVGASLVLLVVGLLVSAVLIWLVTSVRGSPFDQRIPNIIAGADLLIASLIGVAIVLTGQAIVTYEVFTGKALPRRGLKRYWQRAIILAVGYSSTVSLSLILRLPPIYSLLLSTALMVGFYALLSWRSYLERERFIEQLRPFVSSQGIYDRLLSATAPENEPEAQNPFRALCEDILGTSAGALAPLGSMAPLFGPPLTYPGGEELSLDQLQDIHTDFTEPGELCHSIRHTHNHDFAWAIPLWNERGLCGVMLLGDKLDGTLYTQEEIEIARAAGERLIDIQAGAEMAGRLMALQRRQMVESQIIDRRTRRSLHDDVLPHLHTAMLTLSSMQVGSSQEGEKLLGALADIHRQIADLLLEMPEASSSEVDRLGLFGALQRVTQQELKGAFDQVSWQISEGALQKENEIPLLTSEVLFYAAREAMCNAARYGRDTEDDRQLHLNIVGDWVAGLEILIEDNGVGMGEAKRGNEGSGRGLALHSTMLAIVGGSLAVESVAGTFTRIRITLPDQE